MTELRCVVERITYQNPDNGYTVMKAKANDNSHVTIVGNLLDVPVGSELLCKGSWKVDRRYGRQFSVQSWEEVMPSTLEGIERYLGSGLIRGIGPGYARMIVERFGQETIDVIENNIERLNEIPRLGERRIQQIRESWEKQREIKNVMLFLQSNGVSTTFAAKIYRHYGKNSVTVVRNNPYRLADDIWGVGFKTADTIASKLGYEKNDIRRCKSGVIYTLNELTEDGHVYAEKEQLMKAASSLLEADEAAIQNAIREMIQNQELIPERDAIYLPSYYYAEVGAAMKFLELIENAERNEGHSTCDINSISRETGVQYDDVQIRAIKKAIKSQVMVLTGGPGTGKTTTTQGIIAALKGMGLNVLLAAPTGRAAKRMSEATGMEAKTIHRLLEFHPLEGYRKNKDNPLDADALIVDECSMIDIILMYNLMKAIPSKMRLILVGDIDQLPSVGAGNVLRDIIDSEKIPVIRLTRIFRQAQSSRIVMNAHAINHGEFPDIRNRRSSDFKFIIEEDKEAIASKIVELVKDEVTSTYGYSASDIQVLTPMQKGEIGCGNLNNALQAALNTSEICLTRGGCSFKVGDRVMQMRNNYKKSVFNGDLGYIESIDTEDKILKVNFDGDLVEYETSELDELTLAYACTIHKSQGSEYPVVIMPVSMSHYIMLQRNLIYTGLTRAKKLCIMIGTKQALGCAIRNMAVLKRNTMLKDRLRG